MAFLFVLSEIRQFNYLFFKHPAAFSHRMFFCILSASFGVRLDRAVEKQATCHTEYFPLLGGGQGVGKE